MTEATKIKAIADIEKFGLKDTITLADTGVYTIPVDLFEKQVLEAHGVTPATFKKIENDSIRLATAVTLHCGQLATEHMKNNPDAIELGFNYKQGELTTVSGIFNRDAKDHTVIAFDVKCKTADMKRVLGFLGDEFAAINS
uniref:Uncharacterized protein n=1 Tax=Pseudomonas phage RVTF4 TaxID=3236931 RepID=A0AB39CDE5_9VIRU